MRASPCYSSSIPAGAGLCRRCLLRVESPRLSSARDDVLSAPPAHRGWRRGASGIKMEKWQKGESKPQVLKASVTMAIKLDLDHTKSVADLWVDCERMTYHNIVEKSRTRGEVRRKLYSLDLREDATSEEIAANVELFSRIFMKAKLVGMGYTSLQRSCDFRGDGPWTFLPRSHCRDQRCIREGSRLTIGTLEYNAESARCKVRPLALNTAPRGGALLAKVGRRRVTRGAGARAQGSPCCVEGRVL